MKGERGERKEGGRADYIMKGERGRKEGGRADYVMKGERRGRKEGGKGYR